MGPSEYVEWFQDFSARFPNKAKWATGNASTVETWFDILERVELIDAIAANRSLQHGGAEWEGDWERIPRVVRDLALVMYDRRMTAAFRARSVEPADDSRVCGLCHGYGLVLREDEHRRIIGFACCCDLGVPHLRQRRNKFTGKEWQLPRLPKPKQRPRRFKELDEIVF